MADTYTTHLNLVKQDPAAVPDYEKDHSNLDTLDSEVWARGKTFNGEAVGSDGGFHIQRIPEAENLQSSATQRSDETFIVRPTGGEASIPQEGDAWLMFIKGSSVHTGYTPQSIKMTVTPMAREEGESGISATIDEDTFVSYVDSSGTITLTYSTSWSADPSNYGITVTGTPIAGDVITVIYVKEVRGTITQSNPTTFVSCGWNLYNHSAGYARVLKYSTQYYFKIAGTYTKLEFSTTLTGSRTTISPVSGAFSIPNDGYLHVTGGNNTDTVIWMTWSDWGSGYNWTGSAQGDFKPYEEHTINFSTVMSTYFPYGLMQVGTVRDEINFNIGVATSKVQRLAYNSTNLASARESGRQYEYDENYIYLEKESPNTYDISVNGDYTSFDHGMEWFTETTVDIYAETIYGVNLKNKLERDVLTISQQTLTSTEQGQVRTNIGAARASDVSAIGVIKSFSLSSSQKLLTVADNDTICPIGVSIINLSNGDSSDLPASNYKYGKAIVEKYATHRIFVAVHPIIDSLNVAFNRMDSSNAWLGWRTFVDNSNVYNGLDKTTAGFVLDARQGTKLLDRSTLQSIVLRSSGTASSSSSSVNTYNSRKFSDYWMIGFFMYSSTSDSIIRDVKWIASMHWSSGSVVQTIANHGVNLGSVSGIQFTYNSDTAVTVVTIGAGSLTNFEIVGLMKE